MMKKIILLYLFVLLMPQLYSQTDYSKYPVYSGKDLGLIYSKTFSQFRIWSPVAEEAELLLYKEGEDGESFKTAQFKKSGAGTWVVKLPGDIKNIFYTFRVKVDGKWSNEVPDPYAKAAGVNGKRAMVIDLKETNPAGWIKDKSPSFSKTNAATDAIIYELHIRDAGIDENSGITNKGKFLGLAEENTKSKEHIFTCCLFLITTQLMKAKRINHNTTGVTIH
jgi:pullulanase